MADLTERRQLGRTGLMVSRMGLGSGYNAPAEAVMSAMDDHGINYFYWDRRRPAMGGAIRQLASRRRDQMVIAVQSYDHLGFYIKRSAEQALRKLNIEYADILFLGWYNSMPMGRVLDAALALKQSGKVRSLGITGHNRKFHGELARRSDSPIDVQMIRYNAAHRGAETDVFDTLPEGRPGITTYTATRWGKLLDPKKMPEGLSPLTASECYRFVLSHPAVDLCMMAPRSIEEFNEGITALKAGPLGAEELERARTIGDHVRG